MRCWTGILLAALLMVMPLEAEDKKAEDKGKDREQQFQTLRSSLKKAGRDVEQALQSAKSSEEKKAVYEKYQKNREDKISQVMKLIEANPKDDLAFRMLAWEFQATQGEEPKVFALLAEHHMQNPAMVDVCRFLASLPSPEAVKPGVKLLRKVLEDSPEKSAKGCACYALAKLADHEATSDPSKATEAEKLYTRIIDEFARVKSGRGLTTLGELAKVESKLLIGKTPPEIESENLRGEKVELKDYGGKVVVLDMWATFCAPCRAMIPHEREMVKKLKDKPFALVSISFDQKKDTLKKFLDQESMPWTHWWNGPEGGIAKEWNINHLPTIYVLDTKGVIRYKEIRGKQLEEAVDKLLAEVKDKK